MKKLSQNLSFIVIVALALTLGTALGVKTKHPKEQPPCSQKQDTVKEEANFLK